MSIYYNIDIKKHIAVMAVIMTIAFAATAYIIINHGGEKFVYGLKSLPAAPAVYLSDADRSCLAGERSAVCIFNPDLIPSDALLAWQKILRQAGIPYFVTGLAKNARGSAMTVLVRKDDSALLLPESDFFELKNFVASGGTLVSDGAFYLKNGQLKDVFGWKEYSASKKRRGMKFSDLYKNRYIDDSREAELVFSHDKNIESIWTRGIIAGEAKTLGTFDDGSPAFIVCDYGKGRSYLLGVSLCDVYLRNVTEHHYEAYEKYMNSLEPMSDVFLFIIKGIYEKSLPLGVTLSTAPGGNKSTVIMSHDVDYSRSVVNSLKFAELERNLGIKSTFFIQTKYIADYNDSAFFNTDAIEILKSIDKAGCEIGSHTVIHSRILNRFPYGTGAEAYPGYRPEVLGPDLVSGPASLCGEIKVPKMIMNAYGIKVDSFRPGHLIYHVLQPRCLEESGYYFSSSFAAADVLSYFPYRLINEENSPKVESRIWEVPIAIDDEQWVLGDNLASALDLFGKIHQNGGVTCVLIHPDLTVSSRKNLDINFEEKFIKALPQDCWKATIRETGAFWSKRDRIVFSYRNEGVKLRMTVFSPERFDGLSFTKNSRMRVSSLDKDVEEKGDYIVIKSLSAGTSEITLDIN